MELMTLKEIKNELTKLNNQLENYFNQKKINFEKATGTTSSLKDVITSKTNFVFDKLTHYVIKDEVYDDKILEIQERISSLETLYFKEIERLKRYEDLTLIVFLKEEEKLKWREIDKMLNLGIDYARTKYRLYRNDENI